MLKTILNLAITALVLYVVYILVGMLIQGTILMVVGIILALIFLSRALAAFGVDL